MVARGAINLMSQLRAAAADPMRLRLPRDQEEALRFLFVDFESVGGLHSSHGTQVEALRTYRPGSFVLPATEFGVTVAAPERYVLEFDQNHRDAVGRAYRSLQRLGAAAGGHEHITILYAFYGPRQPAGTRAWAEDQRANGAGLGAYLPLARYTPTALRLARRASEAQNAYRVRGVCADVSPLEALADAMGFDDRERDRRIPPTQSAERQRHPAERRELLLRVKRECEQMLVRATTAYVAAARGAA